MKTSETTGKLLQALSDARAEFAPIKKTKTNPHLKNRYADMDAILEATRPALTAHGVCVLQSAEDGDDGGGIRLVTRMTHCETGEFIESEKTFPMEAGAGRSTAQSMGAIITYAERYTYSALVGCVADSDEDGNSARPSDQQQTRPQAVKPAPRVVDQRTGEVPGAPSARDILKSDHLQRLFGEDRAAYERYMQEKYGVTRVKDLSDRDASGLLAIWSIMPDGHLVGYQAPVADASSPADDPGPSDDGDPGPWEHITEAEERTAALDRVTALWKKCQAAKNAGQLVTMPEAADGSPSAPVAGLIAWCEQIEELLKGLTNVAK